MSKWRRRPSACGVYSSAVWRGSQYVQLKPDLIWIVTVEMTKDPSCVDLDGQQTLMYFSDQNH